MKKIALCMLAFCVLCIGCAFGLKKYAASFLTPANIATESEKILGSPLRLQSPPALSFFPPCAEFENLAWQGEINGTTISASFPSGRITLELWPLLQKKISIAEISLDKPEIALTLPPSHPEKTETQSVPENGNSPATSTDFIINNLSIKSCVLKLIYGEEKNFELANLNLTGQNVFNQREQNIAGDFSLLTRNGQSAVFLGIINLALNSTLFDQQFTLRKADITFNPETRSAADPSNPVTASLAGNIDFASSRFRLADSHARYGKAVATLKGEGSLAEKSFSGILGCVVSEDVNAGADTGRNELIKVETPAQYQDRQIRFSDLAFAWPEGIGNGVLVIKLPDEKEKLSISGNLRGTRIVLSADSRNSHEKPALAQEKSMSLPSISWPALDVGARLSELDIGSLKFNDISLKIAGENGQYCLKPFSGAWAGGSISGDACLSAGDAKMDINFSGKDIVTGGMLAELGASGFEGGKTAISGRLGLDLSRNILSSLSGKIRLMARKTTIDALRKIAQALPLLQGTRFALPSEVDSLAADCAMDKGIFYCKPVTLAAKNAQIDSSVIITPATSEISGHAIIKTLGMELPVNFSGPFDNISWHTGKGFFKELGKLLP